MLRKLSNGTSQNSFLYIETLFLMWYNRNVKNSFFFVIVFLWVTFIGISASSTALSKPFRVDSRPVKGIISYKKEGALGGYIRTNKWTPALISPEIKKNTGEKYIIKVEKPNGLWIWKGEKTFNPDIYFSDVPFMEIELEKSAYWERVGLLASIIVFIGAVIMYYFIKRLRKKKVTLEKEIEEIKTMKIKVQPFPSQIGQYKIISKQGEGGFACVYKAEDTFGDVYALKVPRNDIFLDEEFKTRFLREIEVGKTLHHPNIARIYDCSDGSEGNDPYIAFEFVEGILLNQKFGSGQNDTHPPLAIDDGLNIILAILSALEYAHGKGIVHRDMKPQNIIIRNDGVIKVLDFGIARIMGQTITRTGSSLGTPAYMSPEQISSGKVDERSDLYAVGALAYQCFTGRIPFDGVEPYEILYQALRKDPVPPSQLNSLIPQELDAVVLKLLQKSPKKRFSSATEVINALSGLVKKV